MNTAIPVDNPPMPHVGSVIPCMGPDDVRYQARVVGMTDDDRTMYLIPEEPEARSLFLSGHLKPWPFDLQ